MADVALLAQASTATPEGYQVPGAQEIILKSVFAQYDGSGAAGNYVPTLLIKAPNGAVVASCPLSATVAAGASADVSWFPRGGVGGGIQFNTPNDGGYLQIETDGPVGPAAAPNFIGGYGQEYHDESGGGYGWYDDAGGGFTFQSQGGDFDVGITPTGGGTMRFSMNLGGGFELQDTSGQISQIACGELDINPDTIGFFGVPAVGQQVSGGTLAGVIAGLVALGLFSS